MDIDERIKWAETVRNARDVGEALDAFAGAVLDGYKARLKAAILERQRKCWATESPIVELEALLGEVESNSIDVREAPR